MGVKSCPVTVIFFHDIRPISDFLLMNGKIMLRYFDYSNENRAYDVHPSLSIKNDKLFTTLLDDIYRVSYKMRFKGMMHLCYNSAKTFGREKMS